MTLFTIFSVAVVSHFPSHETIRCSIYMGEPSQIQSESVYLFWGSLKELLHMLHWIFGYRFLNTWIVLTAEKAADKSPSGLGHKPLWRFQATSGPCAVPCTRDSPTVLPNSSTGSTEGRAASARFDTSLHVEEGAFHTPMKVLQLTQNYKVKESI